MATVLSVGYRMTASAACGTIKYHCSCLGFDFHNHRAAAVDGRLYSLPQQLLKVIMAETAPLSPPCRLTTVYRDSSRPPVADYGGPSRALQGLGCSSRGSDWQFPS